jgi:RNA polymerase-binding transcription factor DksA
MERTLEARLKGTNDALARMEAGTYGSCQVCGQEIEREKLDASPATTTCKLHVGDE